MNLKIGDKVKYTFPNQIAEGKNFIVGEVDFISDKKVSVVCGDKKRLTITDKNIERIEKIN